MIITSNKSFNEWGAVLGDDILATAILDRLLHHWEVLSINGPIYRLRNRMDLIPGANMASWRPPDTNTSGRTPALTAGRTPTRS